jgi:negative regulator of flagellin synthesis FlgM
MQIQGLQAAQSIQSLGSTSRAKPAQVTEAAAPVSSIHADQLDLSAEAQALSDVQAAAPAEATSGIRQEKVDSIRQAIADGTYDSPEKLSAALDRLLDTFA